MRNINHQALPVLFLILSLLAIAPALATNKPDLMLAKVFDASIDVSQYWVSEKLDGMRARWDGQQLISRGGNLLNAPKWFTQDFPKTVLDGELWIARGEYQQTVSIVRKQQPHLGWKKIKFMIFDLPDQGGDFSERVKTMQSMAKQSPSPFLHFIEQVQIASHEQLMQYLQLVTDQGGEGLMLHHKKGLYHSGRSLDLLKLKPFADAEAIVTGYRPGKGQFTGKMGALQVKAENGKSFFIGSGFNHQERDMPPPIGSTISYRYQGYTERGIPRFAVFLRVRDEP
ncbi:MAG: DNA ligase [Methyloprofundus sp.]|nr:DNA ligase [Methyloprofundus sp.]MDT8426050.1 DNA ligase [Methyloprofundus sp.]